MRLILAAALCAAIAAPALAQRPAVLEAALSGTPREADPAGGARVTFTGPIDLDPVVGDDARLLREDGDRRVYAFTPTAFPMGEGDGSVERMLDHLAGEIGIDVVSGELVWLRLYAPESFKPNMAVRIRRFEMVQRFVHEPAYAAPRMERLEMALEGSAAFQAFEQTRVIEVSNLVFEPEDAQSADLGGEAESP